jgi:hypothetical protein
MEPRGCNRWQPLANPPPQEPRKQAKAVAVGCDRLPGGAHGKEGVDGSSPSEGSAKAPHIGFCVFGSICRFSNVVQVWSPLWSLQVEKAVVWTSNGAFVAGA